MQIGVKILVDGVDLFTDIHNTVKDYETHNYVRCGIDIAKTVMKLIDVVE